MDWKSLGPRRRKSTSFTLDAKTDAHLGRLSAELGVSRSRIVDLLIQRAAIRAGWQLPDDLSEYTAGDQKRLERWYRRTLLRLRREAKAAARRR